MIIIVIDEKTLKTSTLFRYSKILSRYQLQKYVKLNQDVTAIASDRPGAIAKLCLVFASHGVNLTYLRTHC